MDKYQTLREKDNPSNNVFPNIRTQNIPDDGITTIKIVDNAVTTAKIIDSAVTSDKLAGNSVITSKIASEAVTSAKIADMAIENRHLGSGVVNTANIANLAVSLAKINLKTYDYNWLYTNCPTCADFVDFMGLNDLYKTARCFMTIGDFVGEANLSFDFTNKVFIIHVYVQSNSGYKDILIDNTNYATDFIGAKAVVIAIE